MTYSERSSCKGGFAKIQDSLLILKEREGPQVRGMLGKGRTQLVWAGEGDEGMLLSLTSELV